MMSGRTLTAVLQLMKRWIGNLERIASIEIADFALNLWEHFAPPLPYCLEAVCLLPKKSLAFQNRPYPAGIGPPFLCGLR